MMHRHFQDTLLVFDGLFFFAQGLDIRDHWDRAFHIDSGSRIADIEAQVKDVFDGLAEAPGINDEFEEVDGGVSAEELAN
jgi:hypothetical protein